MCCCGLLFSAWVEVLFMVYCYFVRLRAFGCFLVILILYLLTFVVCVCVDLCILLVVCVY